MLTEPSSFKIGQRVMTKQYGTGRVVKYDDFTDAKGIPQRIMDRRGVVLDVHPFIEPIAFFWMSEMEEIEEEETHI